MRTRTVALLAVLAFAISGCPASDDTLVTCSSDHSCPDPGFTCDTSDNKCHTDVALDHTLELLISSTGGKTGTVDVQGQEACTLTKCTYKVPRAAITLTPRPGPDSAFAGWSGDCASASGPATIIMDANRTCGATFGPVRYMLSVHAAAGGTVTTDSAGVDCSSGSCVLTVDDGSTVNLTAAADAGHRFVGWSGDGDCNGATTASIAVHVNADRTCTATFKERLTISGSGSPPGSGIVLVSADPAGAPSCTAGDDNACTVDTGTTVTLVAAPGIGFAFSAWSGGCNGPENPLSLVPSSSVTCTATFLSMRRTLTAVVDVGGTVKVSSTSASGVCPSDSSCTVDFGQPVSITATADATHAFTGWSGDSDCTGAANPLDIPALTADETCTASFAARIAGLPDVSHVEYGSDFMGAALAFDEDGALLVAHKPDPGTFVSLSRYDDATNTWVALSTAVNERPTRNMLALEVDGAGVPWIALVQETEADPAAWELVLEHLVGTSLELAAPVLALPGARGGDISQGSMIFDSQGRPVITFSDPNTSNIEVLRLEDGALVSLATVTLAFDPHVALDTDGTPLIAFLQGFGGSNAAAFQVGRVEDGNVHLVGSTIDSVPDATQGIASPHLLMRGAEPWAFWVKNGLAHAARWDGTSWVPQPFDPEVQGGFAIDCALLDGDPILAASRTEGMQVLRFHGDAWEPGIDANPGDHLDRIRLAVRGHDAALVSSNIFIPVAHVQRIRF